MFSKDLPRTVFFAQLALLITNLIWGAASPIIKYTLAFIPPFTFLFLRFLIVCVMLLPITLMELKKTKVDPKDYWNLFLLGIFSQTSIIITFISLENTSALDNTLIGIMASVLTVYAGHYFYKEKMDSKLKYGVIIASLGTLLVALEPILFPEESRLPVANRLLGNFLAMAYTLTWITYVIWSKMSMGARSTMLKKTLSFINLRPMVKKYSPSLIAFLSFYVGLITIMPFALLEYIGIFGPHDFNINNMDPRGLVGLLYMAIFSSIVAYTLNQISIEQVPVADIAIFGYLGPVFAFPVAYYLLGESPTPVMIIGGAIIALGVIIAEKRKS
jgi:drug/metabolite transporter (DMT)-like permease